LHYNNLLKKIIKNFKYRLAKDVWNDFCLIVEPFFIEKIKFYQKIDNGALFVQPIPLYDKKLRQRGFNQSEIIADYFNKFLKFPTSAVLIRKKETLTQASITNTKRRCLNMKNAFGVVDEKAVKNKHFIIIDDVLTSGSTVHSAARVLKINGARKAYVLTLAKG
jgi:competence protein ComFC